MSYCFNPHCQHPQNPGNALWCQSCGSALVLSPVVSSRKTQETAPEESTTPAITISTGSAHQISGLEPLAPEALTPPPNPQYRGIKLLGQGGFGRTFLVVDQSQPVQPRSVIKQLFTQGALGDRRVDLFHQEVHQLHRLGKHPQIPSLITCFEQDHSYYLVQELIEGENLAQELSRKGAFDEGEIRQLLQELLPVLEFIHRSKVIHRDLKPENIIRRLRSGSERRRNLVLVDFGAAKLVTAAQKGQVGTMIGSAAYTAPEQLMGKATFASDLYSLGVTCIHLLTGLPPFDLFDGHNGLWVWQDYLRTPVSAELAEVLNRMLEGPVNRRFPSATAVLRSLKPHSRNHSRYIGILPGLKLQQSLTAQAVPSTVSHSQAPDVSTADLAALSAPTPVSRSVQAEAIQVALQAVLATYPVDIQVSWGQKSQLTVVLNRTSEISINYPQLSTLITYELTLLQIKAIQRVKILGRVKHQTVPEWQKVLILDRGIQLRNHVIRLQHHPRSQALLRLKNQGFWLSQIHRKEFWMDILMVGMIGFIFTRSIVIFTPILGCLVALGFFGVKRQVNRTIDLNINSLFATITTLFVLFGSLNIRVFTEGLFGVILAGLFIAMPTFYGRGEG
ncbi:MAG: serine/threonine protein kinase [Oscillatoriales cyanobacterium RM2_1_1]|nr:serine/threonine protein kinase [Oscillatoriales cyanobacterium SM2_3_0]NJO45770.1 serine/threonine protein kinase [Oscillatoriales cyanobacterium RM2_1_1]